MKTNTRAGWVLICLLTILGSAQVSRSQLLWTVGLDDNDWPTIGTLGGPEANFVQEGGGVNALPGSPFSTSVPQGADNDYYFAGTYFTVITGNGEYDPVGVVDLNEEAAERAVTSGDLQQRYHFNLPDTMALTDLVSVTFDAFNLDTSGTDPRFGVEVYFNGVKVGEQVVIRSAQLGFDYTTPPFTLASVNAELGPGPDNIVTLRGISYSAEGGGDWMGIDYIQLQKEQASTVPAPVFPWSVGREDDAWPTGDGGGTNATFVEASGTTNALPGSPTSTETPKGADDDYYFAGIYTNVIAANGTYEPVGVVSANEEAAERGFSGTDNELRYHFNLPVTMQPTDRVGIVFDAISLATNAPDPRYGVEVYVNGVQVQTEIIIRPAQLDQQITTPGFTLASVNAQFGFGYDNIVTLRGISYSATGGGDSLGIDFVGFKYVPPPPVLPWSVGRNDNAHPAGDGGGPNASFVQENNVINLLPGNPNNAEVNRESDNDYYFAGVYTTVIPGNGTYTPVGDVARNEESAERAFAAGDNDLRYHFNLPANTSLNGQFTFSFDPLSLDDSGGDPHYGASVYVNGVQVMPEVVIRPEQLNQTIFTPPFTLAQVGAQVGPGPDNIISLRGVNYSAEGGGNWMGVDYVRLDPVLPSPWPLDINSDNNSHAGGVGGGVNALFVQEAGVNMPPGNPAGAEINQQSDDDYYFAGIYTNVISSVVAQYGDYTPVGTVLVNEYAAERAFAGSDNEERYHFNLPADLKPTDQLLVTFDALDLDATPAQELRKYGVEIYFNGVLVQPEIPITFDVIDVDYTTEPFTLASVNAEVGPGYDNIVTLRGVNYNSEGGGNWMGIDYVQVNPLPKPVFPVEIGRDDNGWPAGDGGGPNASFVQENGTVNDLPGSPRNREVNQQADNDYYMAGVYSNIVDINGSYIPVGIVARNEEAAERALTPGNNELRYHFNIPSDLSLTNQVAITFDAFNLQDPGVGIEDPRYGVEVYFNSVLVQPEIIIRTNQLDTAFTTPAFTLASVDARPGNVDNIVTLRGIAYNAEGGGNWMGVDYVRVHLAGDTGQPSQFTSVTATNGEVTLVWTGPGNLEWAPVLTGPWTPITPSPSSPYTEDIAPNQQSRFFRLRRP